MENIDSRKALELAGKAAGLLLNNGAEIKRTDRTVCFILEHCGFPDYHTFIFSNGLFITINEDREDRCSMVREFFATGFRMDIIIAVNEASRKFVVNEYTADQLMERLEEIEKMPPPERKPVMPLAAGIGSAAFCYLMGGRALDIPAAFVLGFLVQVLLYLMPKTVPKFLSVMLGSFLCTLCGCLLVNRLSVLQLNLDYIVIGIIIPLLPGVSFTTSIREFFNSENLSATVHLTDALLTAACIAVGVGLALQIGQ